MTNRLSIIVLLFFIVGSSVVAVAQSPKPGFEVGTVWTYSASSADASVNGKVLTVELLEKKSSENAFNVSVGNDDPKKISLFAHNTSWFFPVEYSDGELSIRGIGPFPPDQLPALQRRVSNASRTQYQYDDAGRPLGSKTDAIVVTSLGRAACVVPAGSFPCTETTTKLRSGLLESQVWVNANTPAVLLHQIRRTKPRTGLITFKLVSVKAPLPIKSESPPPVAAPPPPQPPSELFFHPNNLITRIGDKWTYQVSSADPALDGKKVVIALIEKDAAKFVFTVQVADSTPRTVSRSKANGTWFAPSFTGTGVSRLLGSASGIRRVYQGQTDGTIPKVRISSRSGTACR